MIGTNAKQSPFSLAAAAIMAADGLIVTAGAGMGVDSGLPDFRGPKGFWGVYPALGRARIPFENIANPAAFRDQRQLAWGFYGHRLQMYRETDPGPSFQILRQIAQRLRSGAFAFSSNVDGHFQKAGFARDRVWECHGSIHHLQCLDNCLRDVWPADGFVPELDVENCRLLNAPPKCPHCGGIARPNILMFGDWGWIDDRERLQEASFNYWRKNAGKIVVIEIGAGNAIPSVRRFSEARQDAYLIRINPTAPGLGGKPGVSLPMTGSEAMRGIAMALIERGWLAGQR